MSHFGDRKENGSTMNMETRLAIHRWQNDMVKNDLAKLGVAAGVVATGIIVSESIAPHTVHALGQKLQGIVVQEPSVEERLTGVVDFVDKNVLWLIPTLTAVDATIDTAMSPREDEDAPTFTQEFGARAMEESAPMVMAWLGLHGMRDLAHNAADAINIAKFYVATPFYALFTSYALLPDTIAKPAISWLFKTSVQLTTKAVNFTINLLAHANSRYSRG